MNVISAIVLLSLCFVILTKPNNPLRLSILVVGVFCLSIFNMGLGQFSSANTLLPSVCFFSLLLYPKSFQILRKSHLLYILLLAMVPSLVLWYHSPHYAGATGLVKIVRDELLANYFALAYGYILAVNGRSKAFFFKTVYHSLIVLSFFAIVNLILRNAFWLNWFSSNAEMGEYYTYSDRFRVQSLFFSPFVYGYLSLLGFQSCFYAWNKHWIDKHTWTIVSICSVLGIFACGCRTVWVCFALMISFYFLLRPNGKGMVTYISSFMLVILIGYTFVPYIQDKVDMVFDFFEENNKTSGSNLQMREEQMAAVMYYIRDDVVFGRGYKFFLYDLGWSQLWSGGVVDRSLRGVEGVYLSYLLERGVFGYASYLLLYGMLTIEACRRWKLDRAASTAVMCIILTYLAFAHFTGNLGTSYPTLLIIGVLFGLCDGKYICKRH